MKRFLMAAAVGVVAGVVATTQVAAPLLAQDSTRTSNVYQQLDLFGDIFERIRAQYVEEVAHLQRVELACCTQLLKSHMGNVLS